jgi:hypothetical protein
MLQIFKHKKKTLLGRIAIVQMFCSYEIKGKANLLYNNEVMTIPPNPSWFLNYSSHRNFIQPMFETHISSPSSIMVLRESPR